MRFAELSLKLRDPARKVSLRPRRYLRRHGIHPIVNAHSNRVETELSDNILRQKVIPRNRTSAVWLIANPLKTNQNPEFQSIIDTHAGAATFIPT
jgi:hypothetical protein